MELLLPARHGPAGRDRQRRRTGRVVLRPAMELDGVRMIASLAFDGYGPAILPATAVPGHLRERFARLPIDGMPATPGRGGPSADGASPRPRCKAVIDVLGLVVATARHARGIHPTAIPASSRTRPAPPPTTATRTATARASASGADQANSVKSS
jgi:DNA-binding transcriptional LysR family regulator